MVECRGFIKYKIYGRGSIDISYILVFNILIKDFIVLKYLGKDCYIGYILIIYCIIKRGIVKYKIYFGDVRYILIF